VKSSCPALARHIPSRGKHCVSAVTSLGGELFILRHGTVEVEVYDAVTLTIKRHVAFPQINRCAIGRYRLAACHRNSCLCASDSYRNVIHKIELSGCSGVAEMWAVADSPRGLSVNNVHNLVVACSKARKLQEYTTHGRIVREIRLQAVSLMCPWHAVQLSTGDYVVAQNTSPGVVIVVGEDGQLVRSYSGESSAVGHMDHPRSLVVTKKDDILVADYDNNRILTMAGSSGRVRVLALPIDGKIRGPDGLCLDQLQGRLRLYVAEYGGPSRVLAFDGVAL